MPVDNQRYRDLVGRAAFNAEFFRGTIQDLSAAQRAMAFVGAPSWSRIGGHPCLKQNAANDGPQTAVIASVVDTLQPFWVEMLIECPAVQTYPFYQANAGGWFCYTDPANTRLVLQTLTAALGAARFVRLPVGSIPITRPLHVVVGLDPVGLSGTAWVNGVSVAAAFVNTNPPILCAATRMYVCEAGGPSMRSMIARIWTGTPTNSDATCLAEQARLLVGGW